ncbi:hypothetical protein BCT61_04165 [Vibrio breoganii]|nr:hypothetical protein A1QG_00055 [Vibrio breoganii ZF-29]OEF87022.1 hypothetical protein B003_03820 [Vibrio breoganii 1C10]PMG95845.1 hypothetical protein BCU80_04610 [Vibrio breoganii]PML14100.1 hypothetical protein BCT84_11805 [Vibrio breoganii]PML36051.1 hypothetical protein BCT78_10885 [Vibrio breoganii]
MSFIEKIRVTVNNKKQLNSLRIASLAVGILFSIGLQKDFSAGGKYFQSSFYTEGLYHADILFQIVAIIVFFWFGSIGFKLRKSVK